jgi:hypothetical protein
MVWLVMGFAASIVITLIENVVYEHRARVDPANTLGTDEYDLRHGETWKRNAVLDMIGNRAARHTWVDHGPRQNPLTAAQRASWRKGERGSLCECGGRGKR